MRKDYILFGSEHDIDDIPGGCKILCAYFDIPNDLFPANCNTIVIDTRRHNLKSVLHIVRENKEEIKEDVLFWDTINYKTMQKCLGYGTKDVVPLFYVNINDNETVIMSQLQYTDHDIVFIKIGVVTGAPELSDIYITSLQMHAKDHVFLGNHQCYYRKMKYGTEIEYKYNILDNTDPWIIANEFFNDLLDGKIEDYVCEYGDVLQKWDYMNYMFYVYGEEEGYISVIPQTNGKYLLKRKIYKQDALERIELHYKDEVILGSYKKFLEDKFHVTCVELPPFRRIRYDIDMENIRTGNVFGVFFDYISIAGRSQVLKQCEIEYLRTRSLHENDIYPEEQLELKNYVSNYLASHNIKYEETFYSKLSFLLDVCGEKRSGFNNKKNRIYS